MILAVYAFTMFLAGFLLITLMSVTARLVLPRRIGGILPLETAWQLYTATYFAIATLSVVYVYLVGKALAVRCQFVVHLVILTWSLWYLLAGDFYVRAQDWRPSQDETLFGVLWSMAAFVALPCFVVSSATVLLQAWFSETAHRASRDPYFLECYGRLGVLTGMWLYPFIERLLGLSDQCWVWSMGHFLLILLIGSCGWFTWRFPAKAADSNVDGNQVIASMTADVTILRRLRWFGIALLPGVIGYLISFLQLPVPEMPNIPLSTIIIGSTAPLAGIVAFMRWPFSLVDWPFIGVFLLWSAFLAVSIGLHYVVGADLLTSVAQLLPIMVQFLCQLFCLGLLAQDRPAAKHLPEFYLLLLLGPLPFLIFTM